MVVLNREHPLARKRTLDPDDLASLRFILYEKNTAMQNLIDGYFESLGVTPRITMEVENNEAIKSLVGAGLGASILPLLRGVRNEPPTASLRVLRVKGKPLMRELVWCRWTRILPNAIRELAAALIAALSTAKNA